MRSAEKSIPPGALISFLQKGLQYVGIEESLSLHEDNANKRPDSDFTLLSPHAMQALSRQHPPIQINVPPATAAAALKARLETKVNAMPTNPPPQQQQQQQQPPPMLTAFTPIPAGAAAHAASQAAAAAAALVSVADAPPSHSINFAAHSTTSTPTTTTRTTIPLHLQGGFAHLEEAAARLESEKRIVSQSQQQTASDADELPIDKRNGSQPQSNGNHSLDMDDQQTRALPNEILELKKHASEVFMCAWNPVYTDLIATGSGDASARIWKMGGPIAQDGCLDSLLLPHGTDPKDVKNKDVTTLEWSPDGVLLATGSYDGIARVWNRAGVLVFTLRGHHGPIFSLKWNKSGNFLLSGSYDKTTIVWDVSGNAGFVEQLFSHHFAPALDVDWKDDTTFASCSTDKTVQICRVGLATPLKTYQGHTDEVNAVKWDPSGTLLASCSDDCTAKVWDVESGRNDPLHDFKSHKQEIYTVKWYVIAMRASNGSDRYRVSPVTAKIRV
jgi:transducin (beta)-like 1